jgi:hypothetical protein
VPRLLSLAFALLLSLSSLTQAATAPAPTTAQPPAAPDKGEKKAVEQPGAPGPNDPGTKAPKVIKRVLVGSASDIGAEHVPVHLGNWLTLEISGLDELRKAAAQAKKPLQLFLNGMPLAGVPPYYYKKKDQATLVRFEVTRTDDPASKETWSALLGVPSGEKRTAQVSVGIAGCAEGCSDMTDATEVSLIVIRPTLLFFYCVGIVLVAVFLVRLARTKPLLRDHGNASPWSLGRTQMAWWFFVVVASFLFIWMITGSYSSLSNSVLALIGISAGTALFGAVIDDNKKAQIEKRAALQNERNQLQANNPPPGSPAMQRIQEIDTQLASLVATEQRSVDFWTDLLSDENGISFHRFQIVVWTLVLAVIFVYRVIVHLAMPDFDTQLLGLMGISSGTYLGFKFPEKQA